MTKTRLAIVAILAIALFFIASFFLVLTLRHLRSGKSSAAPSQRAASVVRMEDDPSPTTLYAHNLRLRKGPEFRVYVRWIRGVMLPAQDKIISSFDNPDSFVLEIQKGVIHANIADFGHYLDISSPASAVLKHISIEPDGDGLKIHGTVHKILPLPVELSGRLIAVPDGRVRFHADSIKVLKVPMKGLLGAFHVTLSDLVPHTNVPGIQVADDSIYFDTQRLMPPPHIRGMLTSINIKPPDIEVVYGNSPNDDAELAQWHNFLRLKGGSVSFGKLTMHDADLTMIDASQDVWFDLDLVNYQAQLTKGYSRMTPDNGLEIFMPGVGKQMPAQITLDWLKDRNRALPTK